MVKIRLRRIGTKGRPFYRVVVAKSAAGRNGAFVETIGTYDPVVKPTLININEERALHWLMSGAQPSETTAYLLNKTGILGKFFEARPAAKAKFKFLDKTTSAISKESAIATPVAVEEKPAPVAEAAPVVEEAPVAEAPAAEAPAEEAAAEA
jgi:small subunit ribosomal protein S16